MAVAMTVAMAFVGTAQAAKPANGHALGSAYQHDANRAEALATAIPSLMSDTEKQTALSLINAARATRRTCGTASYPAAPPVAWNTLLEQAAQRHSNDMASRNFFSHTGSDRSSPSQRITAAGYVWGAMGENIAAGYPSVQTVVAGWLKSPGHCANIMNSRFKDIGLARAVNTSSRYGTYWTLDLAAPR
ncbi:CAP domain-containing protein [Methylomagnum sp.]